jgi:hypothetical protein
MDDISLVEKNPEMLELLINPKILMNELLRYCPDSYAKLICYGGMTGSATDRAKTSRELAVMDMLIMKRLDGISSRLSALETIAGLSETVPSDPGKSSDADGSPLVIDGVEISRDTHWSKVVNLVNALEDPKMIETIMNSDERNGVKKACLERLKELNFYDALVESDPEKEVDPPKTNEDKEAPPPAGAE